MSQDKKDHRLSVYENVPAPRSIDKNILDQFNDDHDEDEDEDIRRKIEIFNAKMRNKKYYDNVPKPRTIDRKTLNQFNDYRDEDEDIRRRSHMVRRNKATHHYKKCFCKIENSFLRFDLLCIYTKNYEEKNPRDEIESLHSVLTLKGLELEMMKSELSKVYVQRADEQACHRKTVNDFSALQ